MALEGSLADFGLADILQLIHVQKKSGSLTMKNPSAKINVLFENGMIVTASPAGIDPLDKIAEFLHRINQITGDQFKQATQNKRQTKEKMGIILINMGAVTKDSIVGILNMQVKELVFSLFQWTEGEYSFKAGNITYDRDYWPPINTEFILMEGVRRLDEWPLLERKIPSMEIVFAKLNENIVKIKEVKDEDESLDDMFGDEKAEGEDSKDSEDGIELTKQEIAIYGLVDGQQDVQHIIDGGLIGAFGTCSALGNLLAAGVIEQSSGPKIGQTAAPIVKTAQRTPSNIFSVRNLFSALISIGSIIIIGMTLINSGGIMIKTGDIGATYQESLSKNRLSRLSQDIHVIQYGKMLKPSELKLLLNSPSGKLDLLGSRWGDGILIKINQAGDGMHLRLEP